MRTARSCLPSAAEHGTPAWLMGEGMGRGSTGDARIRPVPLPCSSAPAAAVRQGSCWRRRRAARQRWSGWQRRQLAWLHAGGGRHGLAPVAGQPALSPPRPHTGAQLPLNFSSHGSACDTEASPVPSVPGIPKRHGVHKGREGSCGEISVGCSMGTVHEKDFIPLESAGMWGVLARSHSLTVPACPPWPPCPASHLKLVHKLLLNGVLGCGVGCHAEPLRRLAQPLLLLLAVRVCCGSLEKEETHHTLQGPPGPLSF